MSAETENIAGRTMRGSVYSVGASGVTLVLGFARASLMAHWLLPAHVGVAALALLYLNLVSQVSRVGLHSALIHHQNPDEKVQTTYFTLNLALTLAGFVVLVALAPLLKPLYPRYGVLELVLYAYTGIFLLRSLNVTQTTLLSKRLAFGKLAALDVVSSVVMTAVGPAAAWLGWGPWAIVAENLSGVMTRAVVLWGVYRPWRPRLGWDAATARWFWAYGAKAWMSTNFNYFLDRFDDFWIGTFIGKNPLGLYSKAYQFARYPRKVVANPILSVFFPTFARIQENRLKLSRAFFRAASLMVRVGCLFSLVFILTAPEFIRIFLGEQWLPMRVTFQLMIVYTLFDPLSLAARNLLMATGHPGVVARVRFIQMIVFVPAVIGLGAWAGIDGVALAADAMILTGALLLFRQTTRVVDYSPRALWLWPLAALAITAGLVLALTPLWNSLHFWAAFAGKLAFIPLVFGGLLWLTEREQLLNGWSMIWGMLRPKRDSGFQISD